MKFVKLVAGIALAVFGIGGLAVTTGVSIGVSHPLIQILENSSFVGLLGSMIFLSSGMWLVLWPLVGQSRRYGLKNRRMGMPTIPGATSIPSVTTPRFRGLPSLSLGQGKIKYMIFGSVALSGTVVAVGMVFAVRDVVSSTYEYPAPGAAYSDLHTGGTLGQELPPYADGIESQTLQINLAADARLSELTFSNMELGRSGLTDCVVIQRDASNSTGYLYVDNMVISGTTSAPSYDMANAEIATLTLAGSTDGHTMGATLDSTVSDQTVTSLRGTGQFIADGGYVDRIIINLMGNATVQTLTYDNAHCSVGGWNVDYVKAGTYTQDATTKWGTGSGVDSADWVLNSTVSYRTATSAIIDTPVTVR